MEDPRAIALTINVSNEQQLVEAIQRHDLVLNIVGPFYRYAVPTARAAIAARVNYTDIRGDVEPPYGVHSLLMPRAGVNYFYQLNCLLTIRRALC